MGLVIDWGKNGEPPKIKLIDDKREEFIERDLYEKFENDIDLEIIEECNSKSIESGETLFIFDNRLSNIISEHDSRSPQEVRVNNNLELLFGTNKYYIGDIDEFRKLPSRKSFYDTETQMIGESRYNYICDYIKVLGFISSEWNIGREYEQSFAMEDLELPLYIRLKPNLFIEIKDITNKTHYSGFFSKKSILNCLDIETQRDRKIELLTDVQGVSGVQVIKKED